MENQPKSKTSIWTIIFIITVIGRLLVWAYKNNKHESSVDEALAKARLDMVHSALRTTIERYADNHPSKDVRLDQYSGPDSTVHHFIYFEAKDSIMARKVGTELNDLGFFQSPDKQEVLVEPDSLSAKIVVKFLIKEKDRTLIKTPLTMTLNSMNEVSPQKKYRFYLCNHLDFDKSLEEIK